MKTKSEYSRLLLDPRWQKKRLEILQRDDFICQYCCNGEDTLHIHHRYYEYGKSPWEYNNNSLMTLCANCHGNHSGRIKNSERRLLKAFAMQGFLADQLDEISIALEKLSPCNFVNEPRASEIAFAINSDDCQRIYWDSTHLSVKNKKRTETDA